MLKKYLALLQYCLPHHLISAGMGWLANCRSPWLKNLLIARFMRDYGVTLEEAEKSSMHDYPSFNDFFIRKLKTECRPIDQEVHGLVSPVDGYIAEQGSILGQRLLQAKGSYFNVGQLLGDTHTDPHLLENGDYATFYLAPHNYHRVHMPVDGKLLKTIYIPGRLFSVNRLTTDLIPQLYGRNERLVTFFETAYGPMVLVLVGAFIVGNIQMSWMSSPVRSFSAQATNLALDFKQGEELGFFKLGSTVILLFPPKVISWTKKVRNVQMGQKIGKFLNDNNKNKSIC